MKIRKANIIDTEKIIRLVNKGLKEFEFDYLPKTSESDLANINEEYLDNDGSFLVIDLDTDVIATGALKKVDNETFKIRKMYVDQDYRREGYGKQILVELIEIAKSKNAKVVVLETSKSIIVAINLYVSFGFEVLTQKSDSPRCDITLIKILGDA